MLQGMQPCLGLFPLPSLDYFPLQTGAGAVWQLGEQVLPCSQENISVWVENPASVGRRAGSVQPACWQGRSPSPGLPFSTAGARLCFPFPGEIKQLFPPTLLPKASCPAKAVFAHDGETEAQCRRAFSCSSPGPQAAMGWKRVKPRWEFCFHPPGPSVAYF